MSTPYKGLLTIWQRLSLKEEIAILKLSMKCHTSLRKAGICVISDLVSKTETDLLLLSDLNLQNLAEIQAKLKQYCDINGLPFPWLASPPKQTDARKDAGRPRPGRRVEMPVEQTPAYAVRARDPSLDRVSPGNLKANELNTPERSVESQEANPIVLSDAQSHSLTFALAKGIEVLELSARAYNALKRHGIDRVADLATKAVGDLDKIRNLGPQCIAEVRSKYEQYIEVSAPSLPTEAEPTIASETSPLSANEIGNQILSTPELLELPLFQAVQYPHMTPESWGDFVANCKTTQGIERALPDGFFVNTRSTIPPDPKFVAGLGVRTLRALERVGVKDFVSVSTIKVRELVAIRQLGKNAAVQLFRLLKSELPFLVSPTLSNAGTGTAGTLSTIQTLVNSGSPERLRWSQIHKTLTEELQAGRLHSGVQMGGSTIAEWLQLDPEQLDGHDLRRICNTFELKLESLTIGDELQEIINRLNDRHKAVLIARFGRSQQTLQEVADGVHVTRERIRQIERKAKNAVAKWFTIQCPWRLQTALLLAKDLGEHISLPKWESILAERNLIERLPFPDKNEKILELNSLELVLVLLEANLGAESPECTFRIPDNLRGVLKYPDFAADEIKASKALSKKELGMIRRQCRNAGAVSAILLGRKLKIRVSAISKALGTHGYVSLDEEWLTLKPSPGTPISSHYSAFQVNVLKMLAVCGPLSIKEIRQGLQNHTSRFDFAVPPTTILRKVLPLYGFALNSDNCVQLGKGQRIRVKPSAGERIVLDLIKERGPVVTFQELAEEFTRRNRSQPLLPTTLRYSVLFRRVDTGLYALRGTRITREDIEAATARRPVVEQDSSLKFSSNGIITWEINVGTYGLGGTIPAGEAAQLAGEWETLAEKTETGQIKVGEQQIWGLAKAFRKLGVTVGDRIALQFDPEIRRVQVVKVERQENEED
jgi:hypothetical protein